MHRYLKDTQYMFFKITGKYNVFYDELNKTVKNLMHHKKLQCLLPIKTGVTNLTQEPSVTFSVTVFCTCP